jgi:hypothetical protein
VDIPEARIESTEGVPWASNDTCADTERSLAGRIVLIDYSFLSGNSARVS